MARKPYPKLPVLDALRCQMIFNGNKRCQRRRTYHCTRLDGSTFELCTRCATQLRDLIAAHRDRFDPVRFSALNKLAEVD